MPIPPNWGPVDPVSGQPYFLPKLPNGNRWVPIPNKNYDPKDPESRPVKWVPESPLKTGPKGSQPQGSWDPKENYGDYCTGDGRNWHTGPNGDRLSPEEVQRLKNMANQGGSQVVEDMEQIGPGEGVASGKFEVLPDTDIGTAPTVVPEECAPGILPSIFNAIGQAWQNFKNFISGDGPPPPPVEP